MRIMYHLDDGNELLTPIKIAEALISDKRFDVYELEEIANHIKVHCDARSSERMRRGLSSEDPRKLQSI